MLANMNDHLLLFLSIDEWLQLYPNHLVIKHHERATLFIRILQLPRSLQISSFRLYFRSLNDSENQLMRIVLPFEIKNGFTVQVFNTTSLTNGYITVSARFAVGGIFHTVASTVGLSGKNRITVISIDKQISIPFK